MNGSCPSDSMGSAMPWFVAPTPLPAVQPERLNNLLPIP